MKKIVPILVALIFGCNSESKQVIPQEAEKTTSQKEIYDSLQDTILEKNDPRLIDLTRHQIFLDTTHTSKVYETLNNWSLNEWTKKDGDAVIGSLFHGLKLTGIDTKGFPTKFVTVRRLHDQFVLYDRCDGADPRIVILDTVFLYFGIHESDAEPIDKIIQLSKDRLELKLITYQSKSSNSESNVTIEKIEFENIYRITYESENSNWTELITPFADAENLNLVVNNCPTMKMREYSGFIEYK